MKDYEKWEACRSGRIDREASGGHVITVDMNQLRVKNGNEVLIHDLIRKLQDLMKQFEATHETDSPWVLVMNLPVNIFTFKTVLALDKVSEPKNAELRDCTPPEPNVEPVVAKGALVQPAPAPTQTPAPAPAPEPEPELKREEAPEPAHAVVSADPINMIETHLVREHLESELDLAERVAAATRDQANVVAINILKAYYNNEITTYDEVEERIRLSPLPDVTRSAVFKASPKWEPIATETGVLDWPASGGIRHKLPLATPIGLIANIHSVDEQEDKYTARIGIVNIPKLRHFSLIDSCVRKNDRTLAVEVLTFDISTKLSLVRGLKRPVHIALSVEKYIGHDSGVSFTVIQAFCPRPDDFDEDQPRRLTEDLFVQPEEMSFWETEMV